MHELERRAVLGLGFVRVFETAQRLLADRDRQRARQEVADLDAAAAHREQVAPRDVLHGDEVLAALLADLDHLDDVGMLERTRDASLVEQHAHHARLLDVARLERLHHDVARLPRMARQVQVGHSAGREVFDDLVIAVALNH